MFLPPPPKKVGTPVNRDIKIYPPLSTQIEKVSGSSPCMNNILVFTNNSWWCCYNL